ncbi:MAG: SHOCT domain-containing protein [Sporichthyaceae bacterium]
MGYDYGNWGAGQWAAMAATMLLFWGMVVALVVWAVRDLRSGDRTRTTPPGSSSPDDVLADRFARGEIDEDELGRRRDLLHGSPGPRA